MVKFGDREVGAHAPVFVTFEAGPTHSGLASAKRLVSEAANAGADAIKFQILNPDRLVANRQQMFTYDVLVDRKSGRRETISEPLYDILCRRALSSADWRAVKAHADAEGLAFFATVGFPDEIDLLVSLDCHSMKIASADVNHFPLIRQAARTGICLQLDTGNSTIGEIEAAIDVIRAEGNENIIIHHCPSGYPARLEGINLNVIPTLKRLFPEYPTAFSDHSPGWEMDVAAVAMGADMVEKTITEDRSTRSVEHIMSLEPPEMAAFVKLMRDLRIAMGKGRRIMTPEERQRALAIRRSVHSAGAAAAGTVLRDVPVEFRRPGDGISPDLYERFLDRRLAVDIPAGHKLHLENLA
jgi:sialic acid synthase SpsE